MRYKTVLILGAGASMPFDFSSGSDLRTKIVEGLDRLETPLVRDLGRQLTAAGLDPGRLREFRHRFYISQIPSIDAFIQEWPEWEGEGKSAIAACLLSEESASIGKLFRTPDWYRALLLAVKDDPTLCGDKLSIITFNYDRSLEFYLTSALPMAKRQIEEAGVQRYLPQLEILHFYGDLGSLSGPNAVPYGSMDPRQLQTAIASVHLIGRSEAAKEARIRARQLCDAADRIYFLGFGYHPENLQQLETSKWERHPDTPLTVTALHYKLPIVEQLRIPKFFKTTGGVKLANPTCTILEYLQSAEVFE